MATLFSAIETQVRRHLLEPAALATPGSITVTPQGTAGATTWTYKLVAINASGTTEAGAASSTTTGNATLDGTNYNRLTWTAVSNATGYWIYRTAVGTSPTTTGRIVVLGAVTTYDDQGAAGDSTTAATANTSGLTSPFWSSAELLAIAGKACLDLWRDVVDLKAEHYLTVDTTNVTMAASTATLTGVPSDVHKIYLIEPINNGTNGVNRGLIFEPLDYNDVKFRDARAHDAVDPSNAVIYYAITGQGAPVGAPTIHVAPQINSAVSLRFCYIPVLAATDLESGDNIPIPGEADNAVIAWTVAYARAKEREDRAPDSGWMAIYATEKAHLLQSLGQRQYQENQTVNAMFEAYWGG